METGDIRSDSNKFFSNKEILFVREQNPNSNFAIRINRTYPRDIIDQQKNAHKFFRIEVLKFRLFLEELFS